MRQGALEYNAYLINNLLRYKNTLSEDEIVTALKILQSNLAKLAKNSDQYQSHILKQYHLAQLCRDLKSEEAMEFLNEFDQT